MLATTNPSSFRHTLTVSFGCDISDVLVLGANESHMHGAQRNLDGRVLQSTASDGVHAHLPDEAETINLGPLYPLPLELRELIWDYALENESPGIFFFEEQGLQHMDPTCPSGPCQVTLSFPTIYHLCRESRGYTKRRMAWKWARTGRGWRVEVPRRQFMPEMDAVYFTTKDIRRLYNSIHDLVDDGLLQKIRHVAIESRCLYGRQKQWPLVARFISRLGTPGVLPNLELISVVLGQPWSREEVPRKRTWDHEWSYAAPIEMRLAGEKWAEQVDERSQGWLETVEPPFELQLWNSGALSREGRLPLVPGDLGSVRELEDLCWMFQDQMMPLEGDSDFEYSDGHPPLEIGPFRDDSVEDNEGLRKRKWPVDVDFRTLALARFR